MRTVYAWRAKRGKPAGAALAALVLVSCSDSASRPTPQPTPERDGWYAFVVQCANCPGLANAEIDRTAVPARARLHVGELTSLRAAIRSSCEPPQSQVEIARWIVGDARVVKVEPSGPESAIVTALAPGRSAVTVERRHGDGTLSQKSLKDGQSSAGCGLLPDIVFEIIP